MTGRATAGDYLRKADDQLRYACDQPPQLRGRAEAQSLAAELARAVAALTRLLDDLLPGHDPAPGDSRRRGGPLRARAAPRRALAPAAAEFCPYAGTAAGPAPAARKPTIHPTAHPPRALTSRRAILETLYRPAP